MSGIDGAPILILDLTNEKAEGDFPQIISCFRLEQPEGIGCSRPWLSLASEDAETGTFKYLLTY